MDFTIAKAHFRKACALEALERPSEAYEEYEKASRFEPGDIRIRQGIERVLRYEEAALGPEALAEAQQRLKALERSGRRRRPGASTSRRSSHIPATYALRACCVCRGDAGEGDFYASPCGHGPFCCGCRDRIERQCSELQICPLCARAPSATSASGIISEWQKGFGESIKCGGPERRPVFGPRPPPAEAEELRPRSSATEAVAMEEVEMYDREALQGELSCDRAEAQDAASGARRYGTFLNALD